jgi:hypothetical protein
MNSKSRAEAIRKAIFNRLGYGGRQVSVRYKKASLSSSVGVYIKIKIPEQAYNRIVEISNSYVEEGDDKFPKRFISVEPMSYRMLSERPDQFNKGGTMTDERIKKWQDAKRDREKAEAWQALPDGQKYQGDKFEITTSHKCVAPTLVRSGQQYAGDQNYWETDKGFNNAILEYLVKDWDVIYPKVLNILKVKEMQALKECQAYVDDLQQEINELDE